MELGARSTATELRTAVARLLNRRVSVAVAFGDGTGPLVCLSGELEGLVEVPGADDAPISLVVGGQDVVLWREELVAARVEPGLGGMGFAMKLSSGLVISVDLAE